MATAQTTYKINFDYNGDPIFTKIENGFEDVFKATERANKSFGDCFKTLLSFDLALDGVRELETTLNSLVAPGIELNSQMADLSAITGQVGEGLDKIEKAARKSSITFGTDATQNVESYKLILSQLSPEIAKNDKALAMMGDNVSYLSKTMGGDTVRATNVLTTAMNQYGVSLDDPIKASEIMGNMMNVMAAGAKEGSAELPQIASALEQAGMMAKNANVSFEETNAAIQVLDKAGKKGSEGGVALRNVLATLSQGRFLPKDVRQQLQGTGVDITQLSNASLPLTERLKTLKPVLQDSALITKLFGKENSAAAVALLNGVESVEELKVKITGTNTAIEQAETIMGSYAEKMKRTNARINNLKISFFNASEAIMPYIQNTMTAITSLGSLAVSINALKSVFGAFNIQLWSGIKSLWEKVFVTNADTIATNANTASLSLGGKVANWYKTKIFTINTQMMIGAVASTVYSKAVGLVQKSMLRATMATHAFSVAIMNIPVIGWIIAAITGIGIGLKLLWDHSKRFREILFGVWEAGKAVFQNISILVSRVYKVFFKPIFSHIWKVVKISFNKIWEFTKTVWNGISEGLQSLWNNVILPVSTFIKDAFIYAFEIVINTATIAWNWLTKIFSGFFGFINKTIVTPIKNVFSTIWDWTAGLLDKIFSKFEGVLAPIRKLWNSIFSSNGMSDITVAYKEGERKGAESFDFDHKKENNEKSKYDKGSILDPIKSPKIEATRTLGGAVAKTKDKGSSGNKVSSLQINKLVENINIYNQNGMGMTREKMLNMVKEALLTASVDSVAIN